MAVCGGGAYLSAMPQAPVVGSAVYMRSRLYSSVCRICAHTFLRQVGSCILCRIFCAVRGFQCAGIQV